MIVGYGIDVMSTVRIKRAIANFGEHFLKRTYTEYELDFCWNHKKVSNQMYTSYWAVKEATMKALGTGNRKGVRFKDIEVHHEKSGKPFIKLYGMAKKFSEKLGVDNIVVSMSHLEDIVVASVIFEKRIKKRP